MDNGAIDGTLPQSRIGSALAKRGSSLVRLDTGRASTTSLVCFPFAGGHAEYFSSWVSFFSPEVEVWSVQLPGRGARRNDPLHVNMGTLVRALLDEFSQKLHGDLIFFGHSMGGIVAYELCLELRHYGLPLPRHLVVSASMPPHLPRHSPTVHTMEEDSLVEELHVLGGTSEEVLSDRELLRHYIPAIRADFQVIETHQRFNIEPLDIPASVWGGATDPRIGPRDLVRWQDLLAGNTDFVLFRGGHMYIDDQQDGTSCRKELRHCIRESHRLWRG